MVVCCFFCWCGENGVLVRDNIGVMAWGECCGVCDSSANGGCGSVAW